MYALTAPGKNDDFILMEIEAIERRLWLEADSCTLGMAELCKFFLQSG